MADAAAPRLLGVHHITCVTADAQRLLDFYVGTLGLSLVKQTVNFDEPTALHLYLGDAAGSPGTLLTWFVFPNAAQGRPGPGMIHRIQLAVSTPAALESWEERLVAAGHTVRRRADSIEVADPDGLVLELVVDAAAHGTEQVGPIVGVAAYLGRGKRADRGLMVETLGLSEVGDPAVNDVRYELRADDSTVRWRYEIPQERALPGFGTVHHIAWSVAPDELEAWRVRILEAGLKPTELRDRRYFRSVYFRQHHGILFELATVGPGFAVDEDAAQLGQALQLPPSLEARREQIAPRLPAFTAPVRPA